MKVLFTSGGTEEPIDGVRRISNTSTGRTGAILASYFAEKGANVTLIRSERAQAPEKNNSDTPPVSELTYISYSNLSDLLHSELAREHWDAVVHLAAVSDYTVDKVSVDGKPFPPGGPGKIGTGKDVILHLKPTAKILDSLREWSCNPTIKVVGFKLTDNADKNEAEVQVRAQFDRGIVDFVVHNELRSINAERHPASFWSHEGLLKETYTKNDMAGELFVLLEGELK